jgi:hypothetical protein
MLDPLADFSKPLLTIKAAIIASEPTNELLVLKSSIRSA